MNSERLHGLAIFVERYGQVIRRAERAIATKALPMAEARLLLELRYGRWSPAKLCHALDLNSGQVSRHLGSLARKGLIERVRRERARPGTLALTQAGRNAAEDASRRRAIKLEQIIAELRQADRERLVRTAEMTAAYLRAEVPPVARIRDGSLGEAGCVVSGFAESWLRPNGALDGGYLELVATPLMRLIKRDGSSNCDFIVADREGCVIGAAVMEESDKAIGNVSLLYVHVYETERGVEGQLIDECLRRARERGYRQINMRVPKHYLGQHFGQIYLEPGGWGLINDVSASQYGHEAVLQNWACLLDSQARGLPAMRP
jgi:DNA-binding MarR family transcriptional regulator